MVDQRLDAMSAKPLQSMEVSALSAAGRFMRLVRSTFTVPKPAAMQEMGHLRTAHGVGPAADRDAGGRWVRIRGGFEGAHGHGGVGGCYGGPEAGWQPFRATQDDVVVEPSIRHNPPSIRHSWGEKVGNSFFHRLRSVTQRGAPQTNLPTFCHSKGLRVRVLASEGAGPCTLVR